MFERLERGLIITKKQDVFKFQSAYLDILEKYFLLNQLNGKIKMSPNIDINTNTEDFQEYDILIQYRISNSNIASISKPGSSQLKPFRPQTSESDNGLKTECNYNFQHIMNIDFYGKEYCNVYKYQIQQFELFYIYDIIRDKNIFEKMTKSFEELRNNYFICMPKEIYTRDPIFIANNIIYKVNCSQYIETQNKITIDKGIIRDISVEIQK